MANKEGKHRDERPTTRIEFAPDYPAVFKMTATGLMSKVIAAEWLERHASSREEIEDAKTAKEVREIFTRHQTAETQTEEE